MFQEQHGFMNTDHRDGLLATFSQSPIMDLEVADDVSTLQTRVLAQVIFESQQIRSHGIIQAVPVQPSWLVDFSVMMCSQL